MIEAGMTCIQTGASGGNVRLVRVITVGNGEALVQPRYGQLRGTRYWISLDRLIPD